MRTILIHGFNVMDGGKQSVGKLKPYLQGEVIVFDYGFAGPFSLPCANRRALGQLRALIRPGDFLVCHSNGSLIGWQIAEELGHILGGVVTINAALRRDTFWYPGLPIFNLHNSTDWVVKYLSRLWGRLYQKDGVKRNGWGAGGYYGYQTDQAFVTNWDTASQNWLVPLTGHSGMFAASPELEFWGGVVNDWKQGVEIQRAYRFS